MAVFGFSTDLTTLPAIPYPDNDEHEKGKPVAIASEQSADEMITRLMKNGVTVNAPSGTIAEIASANGKVTSEILGKLITRPSGKGVTATMTTIKQLHG